MQKPRVLRSLEAPAIGWGPGLALSSWWQPPRGSLGTLNTDLPQNRKQLTQDSMGIFGEGRKGSQAHGIQAANPYIFPRGRHLPTPLIPQHHTFH